MDVHCWDAKLGKGEPEYYSIIRYPYKPYEYGCYLIGGEQIYCTNLSRGSRKKSLQEAKDFFNEYHKESN